MDERVQAVAVGFSFRSSAVQSYGRDLMHDARHSDHLDHGFVEGLSIARANLCRPEIVSLCQKIGCATERDAS